MTDDWQARVRAVWDSAAEHTEPEMVAAIDALVAERPADDPAALFEAASARDFAGLESEAAPLYERALSLGLAEPDRGRAVIQLGSTLRNLDRFDESVGLLRSLADDHPLKDAANAFLALTLASSGDPIAATATALESLSRHLPEYRAAVARYAADLLSDDTVA